MAQPLLPACGLPRSARSDGVQLPFGERPDGSIVHISEVASGLRCDCVCPGCKSRLVARKGPENEHHFGHYRTAPCARALESALHKLAKQVLDERRQLLVPEVRAVVGDRNLVAYKEEVHNFDDAVLEHHLDLIVPDVIVRKGKHRLLVEMFVTHPCGPEKIARIRALGYSCLEIDLRPLPRNATREQVEDALLGAAGRTWIYNPKLERAEKRLREEIAAEEEAASIAREQQRVRDERRVDALVRSLAKLRDQPRPSEASDSDTVIDVCFEGYGELIGKQIQGDFCFAATSREWQAAILRHFVLGRLEEGRSTFMDFHAKDVLKHLKVSKAFRAGMPTYFAPGLERAVMEGLPEFRAPYRIVEAYLEFLADHQVLRRSHRSWMIADQAQRKWAERRKRLQELSEMSTHLRDTAARLVKALPEEERRGFSLDAWWDRPHPQLGLSLAEAVAKDDRRLSQLSLLLHQVESMMVRNGEIVDDLLGLPLTIACDRLIETRRLESEHKRKFEAEQARLASESRTLRLASTARDALGSDAVSWLNSPHPALDGTAPRAAAAESYDGLDCALRQLADDAKKRRARLGSQALRTRLLDLAGQMRKPDHARLFLSSPHPGWHNQRPIECVVDHRSFEEVKRLMTNLAA